MAPCGFLCARLPLTEIIAIPLHFGRYSELQGITIDGRLAVLVDTEQMMHVVDGAVQKPFYGKLEYHNQTLAELAPHAARPSNQHCRLCDYTWEYCGLQQLHSRNGVE